MNLWGKIGDADEVQERDSLNEDFGVNGSVASSSGVKPKKKAGFGKLMADVMGGDMFSKDGFVGMFPFIFYIVFLSMFYITNVYIAEDMSRDIMKLNRRIEDLHVEYVYLQSEITKITKQSNMVGMLKDKGIKESVEPLKKIVVDKKGGRDED